MLSRYAPWFAGDDAFRPLFSLLTAAAPAAPFGAPGSWLFDAPAMDVGPKADILEKDGGLEIVCDLPGVRPEDVSVTAENGVLTIQARRTLDHGGAAVRWAERYEGSFTRSFALGDAYDMGSAAASLHDGVLVVKVATRPEAAPKKIPIQFAADAASKQLGGKSEAAQENA